MAEPQDPGEALGWVGLDPVALPAAEALMSKIDAMYVAAYCNGINAMAEITKRMLPHLIVTGLPLDAALDLIASSGVAMANKTAAEKQG